MDGTFIDMVIKKLQWLLDHPELTWSGSGNYALELTGSAVLVVASWCFWRKKQSPPSSKADTCPLNPTNSGGEQNNLQGDHGIAKQINNYGVPLEKYEQTKKELDVSDAALASFFKILEQGKVACEEWNVKLPEIAFRYKELLQRFESVTSDDLEVKALKEQTAGQAIADGNKKRKGAILNNIAAIAITEGDYRKALKYLEQSLLTYQEVGYKEGEGITLNNIGQIHQAMGDYATALKYLE